MSNVTDEIKRFLELHHRGAQRTAEEHLEYEALRRKVSAALQEPLPSPKTKPQS